MKEEKKKLKIEPMKIIIVLLVTLACISIIVFGMALGKRLSDDSKEKIKTSKVEETYCFVAFESNGGTKIDEQKIIAGQKIIKPANPVKTGYQFKGWYLNDELYDFENSITKNTVLRAKWESISDTEKVYISFDSNGGNVVEKIEAEKGTGIEPPLNPTKTGYEFKGWYLNNNLFNFNNNINEDITLLAEWDKIETEVKDTNYSQVEEKVENNSNETEIQNNKEENKQENKQENKVENTEVPEIKKDEEIIMPAIWQLKVVYNSNGSIDFSNYNPLETSQSEKDIDGIEILRSTSENGNFKKVVTIPNSQLEYTVKSIDRSVPYYYTARTYKDVNGTMQYGDIVFTQYVPAEITSAPSNIYFSTEYSNKIKATCNPVKGATEYCLIKSTTKNGEYEHVNVSNTASIDTVWGAKDAYYKIYAYDEADNGQYEIYGPESDAIFIPKNFEDSYVKNVEVNKPYEEVWKNGKYVKEYKGYIEITFDPVKGATGYLAYQGFKNITEIADETEPKITFETSSITTEKVYVKPYKKGNNYLLYGEQTSIYD